MQFCSPPTCIPREISRRTTLLLECAAWFSIFAALVPDREECNINSSILNEPVTLSDQFKLI